MSFTREQKLACLTRELSMRKRTYPRWVGWGHMKQEEADHEIAVMETILKDYEQQLELFDQKAAPYPQQQTPLGSTRWR